ncbi:TetR/AcrR family transcriptional regulator [Actinomadura vinacea]|uniref:TetR/AcrR family transcriptional regulator n=1 Tax=Actinomadura vinacea TaxID=115336 RepID=A0ABP5X217_9ACTN
MARPRTTSDEAVLRAAGRVLGRLGPGRLTLAAVAAEAGLAPATIVQRFGSKRGLLLALARRAGPDARRFFQDARNRLTRPNGVPGGPAGGAGPLEVLLAALQAMAGTVRTPEEMANSLAFLQLDLTDPEFRELATLHFGIVGEEITALLAEAAAAGDLAPGADTAALARSVHIAYNGVLIVWAMTGEGGTLEQALHAGLDRLLAPHRA